MPGPGEPAAPRDKAIPAALIGVVGGVIAAVVGAAAAGWFAPQEPDLPPLPTTTLTIAPPPTTTTPRPTTPSQPPVDSPEPVVPVGPTMVVTPQIVSAGKYYTVRGSGFQPGSGITLRFYTTGSISYPVAKLLAVDQRGEFTFVPDRPFNADFCGVRGTIAASTDRATRCATPRLLTHR